MKWYIDWFMGGFGAVALIVIPNAMALLKVAGIW